MDKIESSNEEKEQFPVPYTEYLRNRAEENVEILDKYPQAGFLKDVYLEIIEDFPELKCVKFVQTKTDKGAGTRFSFLGNSPKDNPERGASNLPELQFDFEDCEEEFVIFGDVEKYPENDDEYLERMRALSFEKMAKTLDIPLNQVCGDGKMTSAMVFLHELGHAEDFLRNSLKINQIDLDYGGVSEERFEEAKKDWFDRGAVGREIYPLPRTEKQMEARNGGIYERLRVLKEDCGEYKEKLEEAGIDVSGIDRGDFYGVLMDLDRLYREMPQEKFADDFAIDFLLKWRF